MLISKIIASCFASTIFDFQDDISFFNINDHSLYKHRSYMQDHGMHKHRSYMQDDSMHKHRSFNKPSL